MWFLRRQLTHREKRLLILFGVFLLVAGWDFRYRRWTPSVTMETPHYAIYSTATPEQTQRIGEVTEVLYQAYAGRFAQFPQIGKSHPKLS